MKQRVLWLQLSLVVIGCIFYAGAVWDPVWSVVDDGNEMRSAMNCRQQLAAGRYSLRAFEHHGSDNGLFRPAFVALKAMEYQLFGFTPWKHHLAHVAVLIGLCLILFWITHRAVGSPGAAWLTAVLWMFFSPDVENWFRMNEASSFYPLAFAVPSLWLAVRALALDPQHTGRRWGLVTLAGMLLVPACFTRETSIAFTGFAVAILIGCRLNTNHLLSRKNTALAAGYLAAHLVTALAWFVLKHTTGVPSVVTGSYTSDYQFSPVVMMATAFKYADLVWNGFQCLLPIALGLFAWRLLLWRRGRTVLDAWDGWAFVGLCWFGAVLAILLPWKHPLARYLGSGVPGLALFVGVMLWSFLGNAPSRFCQAPSRGLLFLRWFVIVNLAVLPLIAFTRNYNYLVFRHDHDHAAFQVVKTVAHIAPTHARLYMDVPANADFMFDEMTIFLNLLFGRGDLTQVNYNKPLRPDPQVGDCLLVYVREPDTPRSTEMWLPESFHTATLNQLKDRLKLVQSFRYERRLFSSYPDAFVFNLVASAGIQLPDYLGMNPRHKRALFMREPSLVEWRIYRFDR